MEPLRTYAANIITSCRIVCGILMLFFPVFSIWFYIFYLVGGMTDMIDGIVARKTHSASAFGSHLDSAADFLFVSAALIKLLPVWNLPGWLWAWVLFIAVIKVSNIVSGFVYRKKWVALHTVMNKITGFLLFILPLTLQFVELKYSAAAVCTAATISAIQEGHFIRAGKA